MKQAMAVMVVLAVMTCAMGASADLVAIVGMGERDGALLLVDAGGELWVLDTPHAGGWMRLVLDDLGTAALEDDLVVGCKPL